MYNKLRMFIVFCWLTFVISSCSSQAPRIIQEGIERVGPSGSGFRSPVWSPDGTKIAVTSQSVVTSWTSEIFVLDISTGKEKSIIYTDNGNVMAISWSPDGSQILLASQHGGDWPEGIWTISADGNSPEEFLEEGYDADWSPDGERIAVFSHSEKGAHQDVMLSIIDLTTSNNEVIFGGKSSNVMGEGIAWSPNGRELAFDYGQSGVGQLDLYILNIATGEARKIAGDGENYNSSWGPGGILIAYLNDPGNGHDSTIIVADKNNSCQQKLLTLDDLRWLSWSPDGKHIAFISHGEVYLLTLEKFPPYKSVCP